MKFSLIDIMVDLPEHFLTEFEDRIIIEPPAPGIAIQVRECCSAILAFNYHNVFRLEAVNKHRGLGGKDDLGIVRCRAYQAADDIYGIRVQPQFRLVKNHNIGQVLLRLAEKGNEGDDSKHTVRGLRSAEHFVAVAFPPIQNNAVSVRFKRKIRKKRQYQTHGVHNPPVAHGIVLFQAQQRGSEICRVLFQPAVRGCRRRAICPAFAPYRRCYETGTRRFFCIRL